MQKTYYIAMVHQSSDGSLVFILEKPARVPEDIFWLLVSDKLRESGVGENETFDESLATVKGHFDSAQKGETALIIHNINFSIKVKP